MSAPDLPRRAAVEAVATALLLVAVVGSGIMADRLSAGNVGLALLANAIATGGALVALIVALGPVSGAQMNPVVTVVDAALGGRPWGEVPAYVAAQIAGAFAGVAAADGMFGLPAFAASTHARGGAAQLGSEVLATFGLLVIVFCAARARPTLVPFAVGAWITGAYWFTSSTSFANPAVTLARAATDTFAGIRPADAPAFVVAQLVGGALGVGFLRFVLPVTPSPEPPS